MKTSKFSSAVTESLQHILGSAEVEKIPLHEPEFTDVDKRYVLDCVDSGWVSSVGSYVDRFEDMLETRTGATRAIATVNGTAALHACLRLVGVQAGDEVLVPTLTFVATANAVAYQGAVPHFVDSDPQRLSIDPIKLEKYLGVIGEARKDGLYNRNTDRRISALVVMHVFGHPADMDALQNVADQFNIPIVEDAAESLGSTYKSRQTGTFGRVSALSFNGNKIATTGGGGAILTMDDELGERAKHLTTTARVSAGYEFMHDEVGYNYRMPNLNAALGCAQLERLDDVIERKRRLAESYHKVFAEVSGLDTFHEPSDSCSNYWLNALIAPDRASRDNILEATNQAGYLTRPCWTPMHLLPMYTDCPRDDVSCAMSLVDKIVNLPSSPKLANGAI